MDVKRESNLELLRILAMIMIIAYHIYVHCIEGQLNNDINGLYYEPVLYNRLLFFEIISPMGKIGDAIFILISGYFMVPKGNNINLIKTAKKLLFQQGFATIILIASSTIVYNFTNWMSGTFVELSDISLFNNMAWFAGYYFLIIVIGKMFFNSYVGKIDRREYMELIIVLFAVTQLSWAGALFVGFSNGLLVLVTGVFLYLLGGYIRKYNPFENIRVYVPVLIVIITCGLLILSGYNNAISSIESYVGNDSFHQNVIAYGDNNIVPILVGVSLFEIFKRINVRYNKIINHIAASTFMVYLLHDNSFTYSIWYAKDWVALIHDNFSKFIGMYLEYVIITFGCGMIIYIIYICFGRGLLKCEKILKKNISTIR